MQTPDHTTTGYYVAGHSTAVYGSGPPLGLPPRGLTVLQIFPFIFRIGGALMRKCFSHTVEPSHYALRIRLTDDRFHGTVSIDCEPTEEVSEVRLNSAGLSLRSVQIDQHDTPHSQPPDDDVVTIALPQATDKPFTITIEYEGEYSDNMEGFYRSSYRGHPLFSTHFEPTDARRAFPCFDQPDMKASFSVSIEVPGDGLVALSNGPLKEQRGRLFIFHDTPRMSTYIVAFVVGKLAFIEDKSGRVPVRVYADESEAAMGRFALDVAVRSLAFYERYFQIDYPLPKLDMVAIPSFAMGAMENWGLVTYRATSLLFDPHSTAMRSKKNIAITVAHELAHMWFGNLVTMKWWNDLWLNEGFATWAATLALAQSAQDILPWDCWVSFINDEVESGMSMDALRSTHRIAVEVEDPVMIDQIFDAISYSKGASIIRMVEDWLGAEVFRTGLVAYLKKFAYSNSSTADLWAALSLARGGDAGLVARVVDPWVSREGFPLLRVSESESLIQLVQERFTLGFTATATPWPLPLRIRWIDHLQQRTERRLMEAGVEEIEKAHATTHEIYKLNDDVSGFYRVLYPSDALKRLFAAELSTANRLNLWADSFAVALSTRAPLPLGFSYLLADEQNYEVLLAGLSGLGQLESIFYDSADKAEYFRQKTLGIVRPKAAAIDCKSIASTTINDISRDSLVISRAVSAMDPATVDRFVAVYRQHGLDASAVSPEFIRPFLIAVVDRDFPAMVRLYRDHPRLKQHALFALGLTRSADNLRSLMDQFETIESHDSIYFFSALASNLTLRNFAMELFIERFQRIREHIRNDGLLRHTVELVFKNITAESHRPVALAFLDTLRTERSMASAIDKALDSIVLKTRVRAHYAERPFE